MSDCRFASAEAALISEAHDKASPGPATVEPGATSKASGSLRRLPPVSRLTTQPPQMSRWNPSGSPKRAIKALPARRGVFSHSARGTGRLA